MQNAGRRHYNLDQVNLATFRKFAANPVFSDGNIANWELYKILANPDWLGKTTFYGAGGKVVKPPSL
jgi:hypothetical protein